jgi:SPOR domain
VPDRMPRAAGEVKPRRSRLLWVGLPVFTVFAVFAVVVWLGYQENARVPTGEPPLVRAIASPYKVAPDDPGGREVADQGAINELLRDEPRPAQPERVLPLPEEPRAPIIRAAPQSPAPAATADAGEAPPAVAGSAAGAPQAEPSPTQGAGTSDDATQEAGAALARLLTDVGSAPSSAEEPAATPQTAEEEPAPPASGAVAVPATRPASPPSTPAATIVRQEGPRVAAPVDVPSREADAALTRLLAEVAGVPADAGPEPQPAPASSPSSTLAAIAPAERSGSMGPGYRVQLAAVREQDDARRAWDGLVDRLGSLVADQQPVFERAETVNGVFYRVQLGPFANERAADRLCVELQRRNASCFVVGP